jgi:hypothetical protein
MYGILVSAFNFILSFVLRSVLVKFVVFFGVWFLVSNLAPVLGGFLPNASSITTALGGLNSGVWWFLDLMQFSTGAPMVVSALVYRFLIRRIPLIG